MLIDLAQARAARSYAARAEAEASADTEARAIGAAVLPPLCAALAGPEERAPGARAVGLWAAWDAIAAELAEMHDAEADDFMRRLALALAGRSGAMPG